ncbi:MAG: hypothetical protein QNJ42_12915 [Crocosphaera sp.]|nr:hypothetical protein [Crocosphaera sp.]
MLSKLFAFKSKPNPSLTQSSLKISNHLKRSKVNNLDLWEEKVSHQQRQQLINKEFGNYIINVFLDRKQWTSLYVIDFLKVNWSEEYDLRSNLENHLKKSREIHKINLNQVYYKKSLNLQPTHLLLMVKTQQNKIIIALRQSEKHIDLLVNKLQPNHHRLLLVRYLGSPVSYHHRPANDVVIPASFQKVVKDIINYVDLNYSLDNLTFKKWKNLMINFHELNVKFKIDKHSQPISIIKLLTTDYSHLSYDQIMVEKIDKNQLENKNAQIPLFILLLALFCSEPSSTRVFSYNYLFLIDVNSQNHSTLLNNLSFPKLFYQLLDESLHPQQFQKCLSMIYNQSFKYKEEKINKLLFKFRDQYFAS